ncbi:SDR family NAD(P)-dependent oxidoreductase [Actinophytocola oryzae]|uniref:SDR family NAD(P)-dependent oxidoreductase n=1 Tax=Actinophytocola oryzae TaxID=502181 RepID=UPI0010624CF4|nr:SDR family NAD(P)-dependent oxidoreductase [Actinophytocola oryzae]
MELRGRRVLVTGATGPLGQAVVRRLADEGCQLVVTGRRGDVLDVLARDVSGHAIVADLAVRSDIDRLVGECGDVDVFVAGAGVAGVGELTDHSLEQLDRVIEVNLRAPLALARMLGERMVARGGGHVVFVSSLVGKSAAAGAPLADATRFGVRGFALGLRQDWVGLGVGVSCVNTGPIGEPDLGRDGVALPAGFRPRVPADVAAAVVKAVRNDRAEVDVADPVMRAGVVFGQVAPQVAARLARLAGGER